MASTVVYDGDISGAAIAAAVTCSGASLVQIPYANGLKVLLIDAKH